ncbi:hypothetical protein ABPG75_001268 [Micractinium tetrahymenae]
MPNSTNGLFSELPANSRFVKIRDLSRGAYGCVVLALNTQTGQQVALKFIERGKENISSKYVEREIINHMKLRHPHIVELQEVFLTDTHLVLVLEYAPGGDLAEYVTKHRGLPEDVARWFFQQLVIAVDYLHRMASPAGGGPVHLPLGEGRDEAERPGHEVCLVVPPCAPSPPAVACRQLRLPDPGPARVACAAAIPGWAAGGMPPGGHAQRCACSACPGCRAGRDQPRHQAGEHAAGLQPAAAHQGPAGGGRPRPGHAARRAWQPCRGLHLPGQALGAGTALAA